MEVLHRLRCHRLHLISTGAFWACSMCGYALHKRPFLPKRPARYFRDVSQLPGKKGARNA